jgi:hypothetical protein
MRARLSMKQIACEIQQTVSEFRIANRQTGAIVTAVGVPSDGNAPVVPAQATHEQRCSMSAPNHQHSS